MGRWFFLILMTGQRLAGGNAASENAQNREGKMKVSQGESKTMESSWVQMSEKKKFPTRKGKNRNEMQKDSKIVRCTLLNGSAWSTDRKYMIRYTCIFIISFWIEHWMRNQGMEEQLM